MIQCYITDNKGQRWRVKAVSLKAANNEIAHARVTGSVGSTSKVDRRLIGGQFSLIAEVHKVDADGNDIKAN